MDRINPGAGSACINPNLHAWRWTREIVARGAASEHPCPGRCPWCYQPLIDQQPIGRSPLATPISLTGPGRATGLCSGGDVNTWIAQTVIQLGRIQTRMLIAIMQGRYTDRLEDCR